MKTLKTLVTPFLLSVLLLCAVSCRDTQQSKLPIVIHDTVVIYDTIKVSDESDIENIKYYKTLSDRLWKATTLVQLNTPESNRELARLNQIIVSDREKHNQAVKEAMISELKKIVSK